jgi:iron-siderophore transport system substrate-binding protein
MRLRPLTGPLAASLLATVTLTACSSGGNAAETSGQQGGSSSDVRAVEHTMGSTEVPVEPQRVVVLDSPHLDTALALGVTPVGSVQSDVAEGLPGYLGDRTEGIEVVGTIEEPDLEAIAALEPDLILSSQVRHEAIYEQLGDIAPTVFTEYEEGWEAIVGTTADALGRADEGEELLADYRDRAGEVGEAVGASDLRASVVRFLPDETRVYGPDTFSGSVLTDVGFGLPDLEYDEYSMAYLSAEEITQADADILFATTYGPAEETTRGSVSALWGGLSAVQRGCQFDVEDSEWMLGIGPIGAGIVLDDIQATLGDGACR